MITLLTLDRVVMRESESHSVLSDSLGMECTVHGVLQARILEWVAVPFSRVSSQLRYQTRSHEYLTDTDEF